MSIAIHNHKKYITAVLRMTQMEFVLVAFWLVIYYALALAGLPITAALFQGFPDRGATFALPASLVVVTVVTYWLGQFTFTSATVVVAIVVLAALSMALTRYDLELDLEGYTEAMVVFTVAFCFLVVVRAIDPAIIATGGEKFLDFGVLQSLMRTPKLPPEDMWFAGKSIQYYYGGHLIAAILTKLTGTLPRYSYNLALSGFYGMLITSAYGLASAIADRQGIPRRFAGIAAGFFVGFAGNVYTPLRLLAGSFPQWLLEAIAKPLEMDPSAIPISPTDFHYWDASRVMVGTINEFPFFAYLNGDLHAHMMGQPFLLFVAALGYAIYRSDTKRRRLLLFVALPPVVGFISTVSFWSFPTALGVVWLSLVFAEGHPATLVPHGERLLQIGERSRLADELIRIVLSLLIVVAVGGLAFVWAAPFILNVLLGAAGARGLGFLPDRSNAVELLIVHGIFLCLFVLYLGMNARWKDRDTALVVIFGLLLGLLSWKAGAAALLLVAPLLVGGWLLLRSDADLGFETVLLVAGAGLVLLVEFVYVRDNAISGRFNTVFKVYMQLWVLWGVAAGVALTRLVAAAIPAETATRTETTTRSQTSRLSRQATAVCATLLVLVASVYGVFSLGEHVTTDNPIHRADDPTLDGLAFVQTFHPGEAGAIEWLDARKGRPHIVSAPGKPYVWGSPASSLTGVPTIVGWYQEQIYRGSDAYQARKNDVAAIFSPTTTWKTRAELLERYDVEYIYYGPRERERYGQTSFERFPGIHRVYRSGSVAIYRVNGTVIEQQVRKTS
ncbi:MULTISPECIES: DUF2298 domain-containing protein [unclassified Haladaptatus]|uniref:DUF2298 domain-containing protein n=1 Tax=unclassified Haladaptatus TaxID=2622732 RepID=UPI00209C5113|nr:MULTISPECIES: DUF2298 domain-containing protein [unclassified Haladaptatus]MCO8247002.1 DUF2298 domain-containing protein [Haladaptatus sp. AB643]MCO8254615.1 DUF2298 domain-containing protein [Haladaptatus sp. AB618]